MLKVFLGLLLSASAFAVSLNTADQAELGFENLLRNPGAEQGVVGWTGTNATVATGTTAANVRSGKSSFTWTATSAAGYVESGTVNVKPGTNNCEVSGYYKTTATDATVGVYFGSTLIRQETLPSAATLTKISNFSFVCADTSSAYKVRFSFPTDGTVLYFDDAYLGVNRNIGSVAQAEWVGSLVFPLDNDCDWSNSSTSYADFSGIAACSAPTASGDVSAFAGNPKPSFSIAKGFKTGAYRVVVTGAILADCSAQSDCNAFFQLWDGSTQLGTELKIGSYSAGDSSRDVFAPSIEFNFVSSSASGPKNLHVRGRIQTATGSARIYSFANGATGAALAFNIYYYPTSSQTVARFDNNTSLTGTIISSASTTCPTGSIAADGTAISRSSYAKLFNRVGTLWGSGDGSTTFNLPNLSGAFLRGTGTGTINSRNKVGPSVGAFQEDQIQGHVHNFNVFQAAAGTNSGYGNANTMSFANQGGYITGPVSDGSNGTPRTGTETYPYNAGVLFCVVYDADVYQPQIINSVTHQKSNVQRIVRGSVNSGGTILESGTGDWSSAADSTGRYRVTFSPAFNSTSYSCTCSTRASYYNCSGETSYVNHTATNVGFSTVDLTALGGVFTAAAFDFICIGDK